MAIFPTVCVIWTEQPVRKDDVRKILQEVGTLPARIPLILAIVRISGPAASQIARDAGRGVEFCRTSTFRINPMRSGLVPDYVLVPAGNECTEYLRGRRLEYGKLPRILSLDPVAAYLGARPGDLLVDEVAGIMRSVVAEG